MKTKAIKFVYKIISLVSGLVILIYACIALVNTKIEFIPAHSSSSRIAYIEEREIFALLLIGIALITYSILSIATHIQGAKGGPDNSKPVDEGRN
jgi:ABC-type uncharacterized transport system permease subunit